MKLLNKNFQNRFSKSKKLRTKRFGLLGRIKRPSFGDGFILLGDAAGLIDAFTGEG